jgi:hypothetical protein
MMKTLQACIPRQAVLDGTADFVVNLADLPRLTEEEAQEFLDSNVLTSGMEFLLTQAFSRLAGVSSASGIYKLSESMGGGKTQSMIVAGILARFPHLASLLSFQKPLPNVMPDVVVSFTGRATDKKVWVSLGAALGATFPPDRAPSEEEWRNLLKEQSALILLDELAFYLVHAASQGSREEGTRAATLASLALTNLFGAVRDYKACRRSVIIIADLQKDWEQGADELARILRSNEVLSGTMHAEQYSENLVRLRFEVSSFTALRHARQSVMDLTTHNGVDAYPIRRRKPGYTGFYLGMLAHQFTQCCGV